MPEYLAPGVFIEEIKHGPRPIEGVSTSTAAFLGETERGTTRPKLVTSYNEYSRHFGSVFADGKYMPDALSGFFKNGGRRAYVCRITGAGALTASRDVGGLTIEAIGPGDWGNRLFVRIVGSSMTAGLAQTPIGFRLQVAYWQSDEPGCEFTDPFDPAQARAVPQPTLTEDFDDLVFDNPASPDYFTKRLEDNSALLKVSLTDDIPLTALPEAGFAALTNGADGAAPTVVDFKGENTDSDLRSGLSALDLDECREVALVTAPAAADDVVGEIRTHCENNKFRFAVIDCDANAADAGSIDPRAAWDSSHAAFYYPWVYTADLQSGARRLVPPSGLVLGLYARTDSERGVWKAPANDILRGVIDLEYHVNSGMQEVLNPRGVNAIRRFPGAAFGCGELARSPAIRSGSMSASGGCSSSWNARSTKARNGSRSNRMTSACGRG